MTRRRLDAELVRRGITESRSRAQQAVTEGRVLVSGALATKPERRVDPSEPIELTGTPARYVGRGGEKLEGVVQDFGVEVAEWRCLDVGSSTGGFIDCLLQRGARSVVALDVGRGQLAWSLRSDPRVEVMERTDVRDVSPQDVGRFDLVTVDVSFISLRTVMPALAGLAGDALVVALCKPQFEVGRRLVGKKGVVRDPVLQVSAVRGVAEAARDAGFRCLGASPSKLAGNEGNREFFLLLKRRA